jgi:phosphoglucosamine mutase
MRFGTDGVRGRAISELSPEFSLSLARVLADVLRPTAVVLGGDSRESTPALSAAIASGMAASGVDVIDLGIVPTPVVAREASERTAAGIPTMGVVVSASHNPFADNGIKVFDIGGRKLPDATERRIEERLAAGAVASDPPPRLGTIGHADWSEVAGRHIEHIRRALDGRTLEGLRLVVDAANGAAAHLAGPVFAALGADIVVINDRPDGRNINDRCGATDPSGLAAAVVAEGADAGIALDGDADRLIAVDATGTVVDGDHVIAICALDMTARGVLVESTVVVTVMANLGFHRAMRDAGITVVETPVGDRHVLEALTAGGFSLGGEQSGHVIFPGVASTGDGLLTAAMLLDVLRRSGRRLDELAGTAMTSLPQVLVNVAVGGTADDRRDITGTIADELASAEARLAGNGRILVRPSGTEPLVRIMVEAETVAEATEIAEELAAAVRASTGGAAGAG